MNTIGLDQILKYPSASSHSVAYEVSQSNSFGCELPAYLSEFLKEDSKLSRADVIEIIKHASATPRDEFLAILFWGAYFRVTARSPRTQRALVDFISDQNFETALARSKPQYSKAMIRSPCSGRLVTAENSRFRDSVMRILRNCFSFIARRRICRLTQSLINGCAWRGVQSTVH